MGTGPVRVGMILPLTQNGGPSPIGVSMRNAAQLAINDSGSTSITLMIQDDHSSADGATQAAQSEPRRQGRNSSLGQCSPTTCGPRRRRRNRPGNGRCAIDRFLDRRQRCRSWSVYLLSFLIQGYVDRILQYALLSGKKSFGIMAPQNDYGNVAAERFQEMAGNLNAQVVLTARYSAGQMATAAQQVAAVQGQIDALFIPEQADGMPAVAGALGSANVKTKYLGTGGWNDARVLKSASADAGRLVLRPRQFRLRTPSPSAIGPNSIRRSGAPGDAGL